MHPVRICMITELSALSRELWSSRTFFVGSGEMRERMRPLVSFDQDVAHCSLSCWCRDLLRAERWSLRGPNVGAVSFESISQSRPFLVLIFLHPVASLAARSASSFPSTPRCAGI